MGSASIALMVLRMMILREIVEDHEDAGDQGQAARWRDGSLSRNPGPHARRRHHRDHGNLGVNDTMRQHAHEFAEAGFVCLVPDLFWRQEPRCKKALFDLAPGGLTYAPLPASLCQYCDDWPCDDWRAFANALEQKSGRTKLRQSAQTDDHESVRPANDGLWRCFWSRSPSRWTCAQSVNDGQCCDDCNARIRRASPTFAVSPSASSRRTTRNRAHPPRPLVQECQASAEDRS
jgi:Dienelactone hydrolase family